MQRTLTVADVQEKARIAKKAPKVTDFIGRKGFTHRQELNEATGRVEDVVSWTPNVDGKKTRAALEVEEAMQGFTVADTERFATLSASLSHERMVDEQGRTQFVQPHMADDAAKRNGWRHRWRPGGQRLVSGSRGDLLWYRDRDRWATRGKAQVGITARDGNPGIEQRDPDGNLWMRVEGKWVEVGEPD